MSYVWYCGAFQASEIPGRIGYRCTDPAGHDGDHHAVIDGELVAIWPRKAA